MWGRANRGWVEGLTPYLRMGPPRPPASRIRVSGKPSYPVWCFPNKRMCAFETRECVLSKQENVCSPNKRICVRQTRECVLSKQDNVCFPNRTMCAFQTGQCVLSKQDNVWFPTRTMCGSQTRKSRGCLRFRRFFDENDRRGVEKNCTAERFFGHPYPRSGWPGGSPPYLRAGPLPWRTSLIPLGLRGSGMMGFPKTLRLDLRADLSDF